MKERQLPPKETLEESLVRGIKQNLTQYETEFVKTVTEREVGKYLEESISSIRKDISKSNQDRPSLTGKSLAISIKEKLGNQFSDELVEKTVKREVEQYLEESTKNLRIYISKSSPYGTSLTGKQILEQANKAIEKNDTQAFSKTIMQSNLFPEFKKVLSSYITLSVELKKLNQNKENVLENAQSVGVPGPGGLKRKSSSRTLG
jgi:hypothetical protein